MTDDKIAFNKQNIQAFTDSLCKIEPPAKRQALQDLFAVCCYFNIIGKKEVGTKLCITALDAIQFRQKEYKPIIYGLNEGKEHFLVKLFRPHQEIKDLLLDHDLLKIG